MMRACKCTRADPACDRCNVSIDPRSRIETGSIVGVAGAAEMRICLSDKAGGSKDEN